MSLRTNAVKIQAFAGALYGIQLGTTTMAQVNADITTNGGLLNTLNGYYATAFGSVANATVAASVAANLGLTGDALASGTTYITAQLNAAAAGARGAVISNILDLFAGLTSDATFGAAATAWNAKVEAANAYTGATNTAIGATVGQGAAFALTNGTDIITGTVGNDTFTANPSVVIDTTDGSQAVVDTFQIVDNINGGAGTDTLNITVANATTDGQPNLTFIENVNVKFNAAGKLNLGAAIGVETITVANSTAAAAVNGVGAVANLAVANQKTNVAFDGQTATTLALSLNNVGTVSATAPVQVLVDLGAVAASKAKTLNITTNASNVEVIDTVGGNVATAATIAATGTNTLKLTDGLALASLAVTGAGSVDLSSVALVKLATLTVGDGGITFTTGDSTATTFSATTGAGKDVLTVDGANVKAISTGAGDDKVTTATDPLIDTASIDLGSGDDTLTLHAAPAAGGVALSGGEGKDTLAVAADDFNTISGYSAAHLAKITGFEVLSLSDANIANATTIDLSKIAGLIGFQSQGVAAAGTATVTNVGANADIILKGDLVANDGVLTVTLKDATGTADVVNLTLNSTIDQNNNGTVDTTSATVTTTIAGVETINVNSTGTLSTAVTAPNKTDIAVNTLDLTATALTALKVTGDQSLSFTSAAGMTKLASIDASAATAGLTFSGAAADMTTATASVAMNIKGSATAANNLTGSGRADTITGGSARDTITGGAGGDTVTGNGGNDKFTFAAGNSSIGTGKFDTITDFVANTKGVGPAGALTAIGATGVADADLTGDVLSFLQFGNGSGGVVVDVLGSAADATTFLANNAGTANAVIAALDSSTSNLYVDNTGDGVADFFIKLTGVTSINTGAFELTAP
jgi:S-layer protein